MVLGNHDDKRPFGGTRDRWEDKIRIYLKKYNIRLQIAFTWFRQGQMAVMNLEVPLMARYF